MLGPGNPVETGGVWRWERVGVDTGVPRFVQCGRGEVTGRKKPLLPRLNWGQMLVGWKSFGFLAGKLSGDCWCVYAYLEE